MPTKKQPPAHAAARTPVARARRRQPALPAKDYPPGWFAQPAHDWLGPLGWVPQGDLPRSGTATNASDNVPKFRGGWGNGTLIGLSERADRRLKEMGR